MTNQPLQPIEGPQQGPEQVIAAARATAISGEKAGYGGHLATFDVVQLPPATEEERQLIREDAGVLPYVGAKPARPIFDKSAGSNTAFVTAHGTALVSPASYPSGRKRTGTGF